MENIFALELEDLEKVLKFHYLIKTEFESIVLKKC